MNDFINELISRIEVRQQDNLKELKDCPKHSEDLYYEGGRAFEIEEVLKDIKELLEKYKTPFVTLTNPTMPKIVSAWESYEKNYAPLGKAQMSSLEKPREGFSLKCRHCDGYGTWGHDNTICKSCDGTGVDSEPL
jgi:hypothetical protein